MSESQVTGRKKSCNKRVPVGGLRKQSMDELFISGYPADKIGVVRQLAETKKVPMSLLMFGFKNAATNFFTNEGAHCYIEPISSCQYLCAEEYIPKVERAFAKGKAVLLGFTHMNEKTGNEALTAQEVHFLKNLGTKNQHDVYALLITGESEVGLKYSFEENEIFTLRSTVI